MPHVKRPRSPRRYEKTFGGGAGRHGRGGSSSDSDFKAFKEYARCKGKGLRGGHHDSDSEDREFPAVAMNLHRAGFSVHHGIHGGGGGGTNPLLGIDTAPELLMLLNAAEELEMTENPHANVFRGVKRKAARDVIGSGGLDPGNGLNSDLNGLNSLAGLNLGNTDLVLFDRTSGERSRWGIETLSSSQITQAIARALRPQPPKQAAAGETTFNPYAHPHPDRPDKAPLEGADGTVAPPESTHPAKIIIFLDTAPTGAAAIAALALSNPAASGAINARTPLPAGGPLHPLLRAYL